MVNGVVYVRQSGATLITERRSVPDWLTVPGKRKFLVETGSNVSGPAHTLLSLSRRPTAAIYCTWNRRARPGQVCWLYQPQAKRNRSLSYKPNLHKGELFSSGFHLTDDGWPTVRKTQDEKRFT